MLQVELGRIDSVRASRPARVPTVLTVEEARPVLGAMSGRPQLAVKLIYGGGLRLLEALRLRVQDVDLGMKQVTVRDGEGAKDRCTVLAESVIAVLKDLRKGFGAVYLPGALDRKYPAAPREWGWQYVFPARDLSTEPTHCNYTQASS